MVLGVDGEDCMTDGTNITIQKAAVGSPNQNFHMEEDGNVIVSLRCPNLVLTISDASGCESNTTVIQLKTPTGGSRISEWQFSDDDSIESIICPGKVIDI